jgi:hypothetical protein
MKRFLLAIALVSAPLAHAYSQSAAPSTPQTTPQAPPSMEDAVALQIGRYQLMIAKQNTVILTLQKQVADLKDKCGEPCKDKSSGPSSGSTQPKPGDPNAPQIR